MWCRTFLKMWNKQHKPTDLVAAMAYGDARSALALAESDMLTARKAMSAAMDAGDIGEAIRHLSQWTSARDRAVEASTRMERMEGQHE